MLASLWHRLFSFDTREDAELRAKLKEILHFRPVDLKFYKRALTHKSAIDEDSNERSNERLEYLGDAVLGVCVSHHLFNLFEDEDEGYLTQVRSRIVSRKNLNDLAGKLKIDHLIVSNIDKKQRINSVKGNAFEALIGAIYLDKGYQASYDFIDHLIKDRLLDVEHLSQVNENYKSLIIEYCQKEKKEIVFEVVDESGSGYGKKFIVQCKVDDQIVGQGKGRSKKIAEQNAAQKAVKHYHING